MDVPSPPSSMMASPGSEVASSASTSSSSSGFSRRALMTALGTDVLPLSLGIPPLPSPNTTAAAAALFRVNQLPMSAVSLSPTPTAGAAVTMDFKDAALSSRPHARGKRPRHYNHHHHGPSFDDLEGGSTGSSPSTLTTADVEAGTMGDLPPYHHPLPPNHSLHRPPPTKTPAEGEHGSPPAPARPPRPAVPLLPLTIPGPHVQAMLASVPIPTALPPKPRKQPPPPPAPVSPPPAPANPSPGPTGDVRKRNVGIPKFLRFLFQMLEFEDRAIISWSHKGTAFQIRKPDELAQQVLPKYFKHNKVSSFQRQLNYFGFKKWTKTQTNICTFSHPFFVRGEKDKMRLIKRKERSTRSAASKAEGQPEGEPTGVVEDRTRRGGGERHGGEDAGGRGGGAGVRGGGGSGGGEELGGEGTEVGRGGDHQDEYSVEPQLKRQRVESAAAAAGGKPLAKGTGRRKATTSASKRSRPPVVHPSPPSSSSASSLIEDPTGQRLYLPTISPPSTSTPTLTSSISASTSTAFGRLLAHSATALSSVSPGGGGGGGNGPNEALYRESIDAAPVLPIQTELMNAYANSRRGAYETALGMHDMGAPSGAFSDAPSWPASHATYLSTTGSVHDDSPTKDSLMTLTPFKFADTGMSSAMGLSPPGFEGMGMMEHNGHGLAPSSAYGGNQQHPSVSSSSPPAKDYLDVLLESAAMDEQLSGDRASEASLESAAWEATYSHTPQLQSSVVPNPPHHQQHSGPHGTQVSGMGLSSMEQELHNARY